jgi:hypothetical protein
VAELKALRLKDRSGTVTAETVPTLDEVVEVAAQAKRRMLLEIKVDAAKARYPGIEEKVLAILDRHAMTVSTVVMSLEAPTWRRVRPAVATCAPLFRTRPRAHGPDRRARALPCAECASSAWSTPVDAATVARRRSRLGPGPSMPRRHEEDDRSGGDHTHHGPAGRGQTLLNR